MIPEYVGPCALGLKMGLILRGSDLHSAILETLKKASGDGLLSDGDVLCITESIVARAQNNPGKGEGTTPRRMQDLLASLADLVSGSADAGTPIILAKGFLRT